MGSATARVTRFSAAASLPLIMRPVMVSSLALSMGISSGSVTVRLMSGIRPHLLSRMESLASGVAKRKSQPSASCMPAPKQLPWIAATTGAPTRRQRRHTSWNRLAPNLPGCTKPCSIRAGVFMKDGKSSPAQKLGPSPRRITPRSFRSARSCEAAANSDCSISQSKPLCLSARTISTSAISPSRLMTTRSLLILLMAF